MTNDRTAESVEKGFWRFRSGSIVECNNRSGLRNTLPSFPPHARENFRLLLLLLDDDGGSSSSSFSSCSSSTIMAQGGDALEPILPEYQTVDESIDEY